MIYEKNHNFSLMQILLLFYLIASSSALFPLLAKQYKQILESNKIAQHILGLLTFLTFTIYISNGEFSIHRIFTYTMIGYLLFIFTTKLDLPMIIVILGILVSLYLYQDMNKHEELIIMNDKVLSFNEKQENIIKLKKNDKYCFGILIVLIIGGTLIYSHKKEIQYGGNYNLTNYLLY